jgi:hypothetical protein
MLTPVLIDDFKLSQRIDESDYTEGPTNMSEPKSLNLLPGVNRALSPSRWRYQSQVQVVVFLYK